MDLNPRLRSTSIMLDVDKNDTAGMWRSEAGYINKNKGAVWRRRKLGEGEILRDCALPGSTPLPSSPHSPPHPHPHPHPHPPHPRSPLFDPCLVYPGSPERFTPTLFSANMSAVPAAHEMAEPSTSTAINLLGL
jgi:hypothetical protein